ncbi:MAG: METTL5 family protein [Thermoplasmata archaeon]
MKRKELEMILQGLAPFGERDPRLEQYATPADIAADLLWEALMRGDISGRTVMDLGCGNGILSIGAKLLGAREVSGVDIDPKAVKVAMENAAAKGLEISYRQGSVTTVKGSFDTVVQNPPFGAQKRSADRAFIAKSIEIAPRVYSLHNAITEDFVVKMVESLGARCEPVKRFKFEIPYAFDFHRKPKEHFSMVLLRFER